MPDFQFIGASPGMYPMLRDASGLPVGTVEPGDVAAFDVAPDADWVSCGGSEAQPPASPAEAALERIVTATPEPVAAETSSEQGNDDTAGTGQEEADQ